MIRIMTSNIWGDYFGNEVETREKGLYDTYLKYSPDVLGFQEVTESWHNSRMMADLKKLYTILDDAADGYNNYTVLVFRTDRFELLESGFDIYTSTDDPSKTVQWAVLKEKASGKALGVLNTHFEWRTGEQYDLARESNANELTDRMEYIKKKYGCEAFAFGDMNTGLTSSVFEVFADRNVVHLSQMTESCSDFSSHHGNPVRGEDGLYHGTATEAPFEKSLDHMVALKGDFKVTEYAVVTDQPALDATDHSPVYVDIEL